MEAIITFKGINYKEDKGDSFIVKFEVITNTWEKAQKIKEIIEKNLANQLTGQSTLK